MKIAYGNSRMDKKWKNRDVSWEDLCKRMSTTQRTTETVEEYGKLSKADQDNIKDVGGFVGGHLRDGRRKSGMVLCRSLLTLDMDYGTPGILDELEMFFNYRLAVYSTHKHTPEKPRLRLIFPLTREVSEEEYPAVGRMVAKEIGIDLFDDTTYQPHRLMYWPSTSSNGEFVFKEFEGETVNPDAYLAMYDDWRDISTHPVSSRQSTAVSHAAKTQADPLTKEGLVGTFCRTYTIQEAIEKFLGKVYEPSAMTGRYDYIPADSSAGVQIFDDKFAYSHHATDPACGKLLNAFDLVRVHLYGELDDKAKSDTAPGKLPSFKAMCKAAVDDDNVKMQLTRERQEKAAADFESEDWRKGLTYNKQGVLEDSLDNFVLIMRMDEGLRNIAFNCHRDGIDARNGLPWDQIKDGWNDSDNAALKVYLSRHYGIYSPTKTKDALQAVAAERAYHPIKEFLEGLPEWDGIPRVDTLLIDYFGAADNGYSKAVMRKTLTAAVARIYKPGTKFDSVMILNGPQGIGKSTFFAKLAGDWFSDSLCLTDMKDKSGPEKLQGYWILELGELAGMRKADIETVKSFISRVDDKYRASYGVSVESHPRQCVIVGSTNAESGFLRDVTGNRRFWPVRVNGTSTKKPWSITGDEVRQIWAETLRIYRDGEKLYLEGDEALQAVTEQDGAMEEDEREGLVRVYLDKLLPEGWDDMDSLERRNFIIDSSPNGMGRVGTRRREYVCNMEIWVECFGRDPAGMKKSDSYEISGIMKKISGWEKYDGNKNGTRNFPIYGKQRAYRRE